MRLTTPPSTRRRQQQRAWAESDVERRLDLAMNDDGRSTVILAMLAQGDVLLSRCARIHEATRLCSAEDVNVIAQRMLRPCKDGSTRSHASFTRELRRQVRIHEPSDELRAEDALVRRTAFGELHDDGMGTVVITGKGERVVAAMERVDDIARTLRAAGDGRTLTQLRSDVALDLLLQGWPPEGVDGIPGPLLSAPAAHVNIVVSLNTLLASTTKWRRSPAGGSSAAPTRVTSPWPGDRSGAGSCPTR